MFTVGQGNPFDKDGKRMCTHDSDTNKNGWAKRGITTAFDAIDCLFAKGVLHKMRAKRGIHSQIIDTGGIADFSLRLIFIPSIS